MKICMMRLTSHVLVFLWSLACVRSQDPPAGSFHTNATPPPCFIQIGDGPYIRCGALQSTTEIDSVTVTESGPTTKPVEITISTVTESTTITPTKPVEITISTATESITITPTYPATVTPTAHLSPNSPEDAIFTTGTSTQSPVIVTEIVYTNQEDERNTSQSNNCSFNPCFHLQNACFNTPEPKCRCPGVSSITQPPDRPPSLEVTAVTRSLARVEWCAPHSPVLKYSLVVRHRSLALKNMTFSPAHRQVFISDLNEDLYDICLQAVNRAGTSGLRCASVWMGFNQNTNVYFYILLMVCGVLMVIVGTLSVCLYKQCKKQPVENPHLTRLISIPNPAFFNP